MKSISDIMTRILNESVDQDGRCKWCSSREWHRVNCTLNDIKNEKELTQEFLEYINTMSQMFDGFVGEFDICRFCRNEIRNGHKEDCVIKELEEHLKQQGL